MKSFKEFLTEKWRYNFDDDTYVNHHQIGPHNIKIRASPINRFHSYRFDFTVNDKIVGNQNIKPEHQQEIWRHLDKSTNEFIQKKKPIYISFPGLTSKKRELYDRYAKHLAKKHQGEVGTVTNRSKTYPALHLDKNKRWYQKVADWLDK